MTVEHIIRRVVIIDGKPRTIQVTLPEGTPNPLEYAKPILDQMEADARDGSAIDSDEADDDWKEPRSPSFDDLKRNI